MFPKESARLLAHEIATVRLFALHEPRVRFARKDDVENSSFKEKIVRKEVFIDINFSKPRLDVFNLESGKVLEFENNLVGDARP